MWIATLLHPGSSHDLCDSNCQCTRYRPCIKSFSRQTIGEKESSTNKNHNSTDYRQILQVLKQEEKVVFWLVKFLFDRAKTQTMEKLIMVDFGTFTSSQLDHKAKSIILNFWSFGLPSSTTACYIFNCLIIHAKLAPANNSTGQCRQNNAQRRVSWPAHADCLRSATWL